MLRIKTIFQISSGYRNLLLFLNRISTRCKNKMNKKEFSSKDGSNKFKLMHIGKEKFCSQGILPKSLKYSNEIIEKSRN